MKNKIYEMIRMHVAKRATHNLGKVEIKDDEVICYVDGKKLKKQMLERNLRRYNVILHCIRKEEEIYKTYQLEKPVHYIIRNVDFDRVINIKAAMKDCHVTFENCSFTTCISIDFADHLTFRNNTYSPQELKYFSIYEAGEFCISTYDRINEVNKLEFINDKIYVPDIPGIPIMNMNAKKEETTPITKSKLQLWLYAKEIMFRNSDISNAKSIEIGANNLTLIGSDVCAKEVEIKADNIKIDDSCLESDVITIDSPKIYGDLLLSHNGLFINGVEIDKNKVVVNTDNYDIALQQKRLELLGALNKIERTCEKQISEEVRKQPLTRVLKK